MSRSNPAEDLLVPCGRKLFVPGMGMAVVPNSMRQHVSGVARGEREAAEIGHYFGMSEDELGKYKKV